MEIPRAKNFVYLIKHNEVVFQSTESLSEAGAWNTLLLNYPELKTYSIKMLTKMGYKAVKKNADYAEF